MRANAYDLRTVLGFDRQLMAPLFQRPYVWKKDKQWEPLWEDVKKIAECLVRGEEEVKPHFMGAIVLDQLRVPVGQPEARSIIDGQQRLTTLQVFMAALRDVCRNEATTEKLSEAIELLMFNRDPLARTSDMRFKVWPTNVDRSTYQAVMTAGSQQEVRRSLRERGEPEELKSLVVKAYSYFYDTISEWLDTDPQGRERKLEKLLYALREGLHLVVIDMDDRDDAQVIFETLNARGTPLLPSDLVKNYLFHRIQEEGVEAEPLYEAYWQPFDLEHRFWRGEISYGRYRRPRIDLFLHHYLSLMLNDEVSVPALFAEFRRSADQRPDRNAEWHLRSLTGHAELFRSFLTSSLDTREGLFFHRLDVMETTTIFPFLLGLYMGLRDAENAQDIKEAIIADLESFLVRRMVCRLTTKNYNRLFLDLLQELRTGGEFSPAAVRGFLLRQTGDSGRWPNDTEFRKAFLNEPLFRMLTRARLRMILMALDPGLQEDMTENYDLRDVLTVEHIMPQHWQENWPLPSPPGGETAENRLERIEQRSRLVHVIGNLSLLTERLNPAVSNGPFSRKRQEILRHSILNLNRFLRDVEEWNEDNINRRSEELFEVALRVWPYPGVDE